MVRNGADAQDLSKEFEQVPLTFLNIPCIFAIANFLRKKKSLPTREIREAKRKIGRNIAALVANGKSKNLFRELVAKPKPLSGPADCAKPQCGDVQCAH